MRTTRHLEYIWLDGNNPQQIRSKTKIMEFGNSPKLEDFPEWSFDGSSTNQAVTENSDLKLVPVEFCNNPFKEYGFIVLCEVMHMDDTPHESNSRAKLREVIENLGDPDTLYGWEQEYFVFDHKTDNPIGWTGDNERPKKPQGDFYCGNGSDNVRGRDLSEEHAKACDFTDLKISGINAEVALGQWEYQIGPVKALEGCDQLWISRFLLERISENYDHYISYHPKPFEGNDWNGSGMHVNFSTGEMRDEKSLELCELICKRIGKRTAEHIEAYGVDNEKRLTGENETSSIHEFSYGISDRTASIRISPSFAYIEDRRPAANANPYDVVIELLKSIQP